MSWRCTGDGHKEETAMGQSKGKKIVGSILVTLGVLATITNTTTGDPAADFGAALMTMLLCGVGGYLLYKSQKGIAGG